MSQLSANVETRSLHLNPEDWFWVTWRNINPLQRPEPQPFDLQYSLARLRKVTTGNRGWNWDWSKANISVSLSREEAYFWLAAMIQASDQLKPKQLAEQLAKQGSREICFEKFRETLFKPIKPHLQVTDILSPEICIPLINLFPLSNLIDLIFYLN